ncbi:hypothetical protein JCGZ_21907 [Jatropha curcas]|uniref:SHSP domain-containing protein n=1 Tax=Jatropha curcas TaxID=180498 RepID=A0A067JC56_JATCU|nr:hypothetical protein JCGZ_21907 [Jatropha curcas]
MKAKRNLTASLNGVDAFSTTVNPYPYTKKLKRLPHVFAKILDLPFNSNADVFVQETPECFRFVADNGSGNITDEFKAHVIEIIPGVTKIVVREANSSLNDSWLEEPDIDTWRFRLPATTCPQMASAECVGGQLIVTVPKELDLENLIKDDEEECWNDDELVMMARKRPFLVE